MSDFLSDADFERFKTLIYDASGITFSEVNRSILESRIREILRNKKLETTQQFYEMVQKDQEVLKEFLDSVTTNLTRFFRNMPHFEALQHYIIPELVKIKSLTKRIKVWSAGCSTGEEPYTIAMVLHRHLPPDYTFDIIASDLSLRTLMVAKQGIYDESRIQGVPDDYLRQYFTQNGNSYQVNKEIMDRIQFDYHNLKYDSKRTDFDIVFCRNVLIYFDEAAQKEVIAKFWKTMTPHSFLFIGHSESLFGMDTGFTFLKTDWTCLYEKNINNTKSN
ncbi:MAG: protein-glutamate O-methyltransferase CheR [Spirochaetaceae bacterium]|nr:protein-glutamate O-methyltransferase CheR [Spirochaetaceae bacterium]